MKADCAPEVPSASQKQAEEEPEHHNGDRTYRILMRIEEVAQAEQAGHRERRRPEADSGSECVLDVAAKQEFFNESGQEECYAPPEKRRQNCCPVNGQAGNTES